MWTQFSFVKGSARYCHSKIESSSRSKPTSSGIPWNLPRRARVVTSAVRRRRPTAERPLRPLRARSRRPGGLSGTRERSSLFRSRGRWQAPSRSTQRPQLVLYPVSPQYTSPWTAALVIRPAASGDAISATVSNEPAEKPNKSRSRDRHRRPRCCRAPSATRRAGRGRRTRLRIRRPQRQAGWPPKPSAPSR